MFKQLIFVCLLVLIATAKKHNQGDKDCPKEKCPTQMGACVDDKLCRPTVRKCMSKFPEGPQSQEDMDEFESCIKTNQAAYDFIDCIFTNCNGDRKMNEHSFKTFNKVMKRMH